MFVMEHLLMVVVMDFFLTYGRRHLIVVVMKNFFNGHRYGTKLEKCYNDRRHGTKIP